MSDLERERDHFKSIDDEHQKNNKTLQTKLDSTLKQLSTEKEHTISLEIEVSKKTKEIDDLKSERKRLETQNQQLSRKVEEYVKKIEVMAIERENQEEGQVSVNFGNDLSGDLQEIIANLEKENEVLKAERIDADRISSEKEIL
jgi:hypothetical protein